MKRINESLLFIASFVHITILHLYFSYRTLHHKVSEEPMNEIRLLIRINGVKRFKEDGLSSLNYNLLDVRKEPLFTNITVDLLYNETEFQSYLKQLKH